MSKNQRQQRMIERVQEDERLRGNLTDAAATALVEWASQHVAAAADDPARPDAAVEAEVQAIRAAARAAARAGEEDPRRLVALADAALAERLGTPASQSQAPAAAPSTAPGSARTAPAVEPVEAAAKPRRSDGAAAVAGAVPIENPDAPALTGTAAETSAAPAAAPNAEPVQASAAPASELPMLESQASTKVPRPPRDAHPPFRRRWKRFASFWNRIRGGR